MAQIIHNISTPNDGLGDPLRTAFDHQNEMNAELYDTKVDKIAGKGLSQEDFTTDEKTKLFGIEEGAEVNVQSDWEQTDDTADDYIKNKPETLAGNGENTLVENPTTGTETTLNVALLNIYESLASLTEENSVIWNTGDPFTFDMSTMAFPTLKPFLVFQSGAKLNRTIEWDFTGAIVTIDASVILYDGDLITFTGIV